MLLRPLCPLRRLCLRCLLGVALLSAGCSGGPTSQLYVMSAAAAVTSLEVGDGGLPALQVDMAALPAYLDNADILVRRGAYALASSRTGHWGERLSLGITHALAADLARKLPGYRVGLQRSTTPAGRRLQVEVDAFDVYPDGRCVLAASWAVVAKSGVAPPAPGRGVFTTPASANRLGPADDEALVEAMAGAVEQLADAIAASL